MSQEHGRRVFLQRAALGAAGLLSGGYLATARGYAANETITLGCIGTGGRCRQLMEQLKLIPGVRMAAVCDVYKDNIGHGVAIAGEGAYTSQYYEDLLERRDLDAVLIGTPDHWHVPITVDACHAGKDVYVEKPLTHDISEGQEVIRVQRETGRVVQVGMQQRSMPHLQEAREVVRNQELGRIIKVHLTWNRNAERTPVSKAELDPAAIDWQRFLGNAPKQPFDPYRYRHWRWFWDFGGGIFTDLMVHFIDVAHWYLEQGNPVSAASLGSFFAKEGQWETPDTVQTLLRYPNPEVQVYFEGTFSNARNAAMMEYMGTDATLYCDRGRYEFHPEARNKAPYREHVLGSGPRGADFFDQPNGEALHLSNWLECIRTRATPNAPVEVGVQAAAAAHLANASLREGQIAYANAMLDRKRPSRVRRRAAPTRARTR